MEDDYYDEITRLLDQAGALPDGVARTSLVEDAVRVADQARDLDVQFDLRLHLAHTAFNSGQLEKTIVAVAWCFGAQDRHPDRFEYDALLDVCTYAMNSLSSLAKFSRAQIQEIMDNIEQRYREAGLSLRAIYRARCFNALWMGDGEEAKSAFDKMRSCPIDFTWEGDAWSRLFECDYHIQSERFDRAYELSRSILAADHDSNGAFCWLASFMLRPLLALGRVDEADEAQRRSVQATLQNPYYAECVGHHILYLLARSQVPEAYRLAERCLVWAADSPQLRESLELGLACWACAKRMSIDGQSDWPGSLPESAPRKVREDPRLPTVIAWLENFVRGSAQEFDERNGNSHFAGLVRSRLAYAEQAD